MALGTSLSDGREEMQLLGIDIGGTKCAAVSARGSAAHIEITDKVTVPTDISISPEEMLDRLLLAAAHFPPPARIGVSCGGPLNSREGLVLSPPNLPGWDRVPIAAMLRERFGVPAKLQNDANACALAEWRFGAGRGTENMLFLTFGTGLGAGLILGGRLYTGTNDFAGECGHIRLAETGPEGYGKAGSFEGFCSGGGLVRLARQMAQDNARADLPADCTAKTLAEAAERGDAFARKVFRKSGEMLGRGLAVLIDLLNPERIVIGSVFARSGRLLAPSMEEAIRREALPGAAEVCTVVPAALGDALGDYAAVLTAL